MSEKNLSQKAREALQHIRSSVMQTGQLPSVRQLMTALRYKSPRSATLVIKELKDEGFLKKKPGGGLTFIKDLKSTQKTARMVSVPLVGLVPCGGPLLAEQNIEAFIPVSTELARPGSKYFLLRTIGDSMNRAGIEEGSLVLVRQQPVADYPGQSVVALIDDKATVKKFYQKDNVVVLKPESTNPEHQPIVLTDNLQIQGVVVATLPKTD